LSRKTLLTLAAIVSILLTATGVLVVLNLLSYPSTEKPAIPTPSPSPPYYLPYRMSTLGESRILVLDQSAAYATYPFDSVAKVGSNPAVKTGDPCVRINATIRSDYSLENPVPGQDFLGNNGTLAFVYLTARIYNGQGEIEATDVTPPYPNFPVSGIMLVLHPGEVDSAAIYLATDHLDISNYTLTAYISAMPIP
jgi:hypothetical protein